MSLSDELRDPWAALIAAVSGGLAWAVTFDPLPAAAALGVGVGVGAVVYGVKALTGSMSGDRRRRRALPPRPASDTSGGYWLERAEGAVDSLHELRKSGDTEYGDPISDVDVSAKSTLDDLRRLGGQVVAVESALARIDEPRLRAELDRLQGQRAALPEGPPRREVERAIGSVESQFEVTERLHEVRLNLLTRMQSAALGLEGLVARLAEVVAVSHTAGGIDTTAEEIAGLTAELEGVRAGLAETEALSRRILRSAGPDSGPQAIAAGS